LSICFPLKFNTKGAGRRAKFAFISLFILLNGLNLPDATLLCIDFSTYSRNILSHFSAVYVLCVLPLSFITICNVISIVILCKRKAPVVSCRRRHLTKFTRLSIVTGIFHCVCVVPYMLCFVFDVKKLEVKSVLIYLILTNVVTFLLFLNNAFSFLLYSLASKDFKQDLKQLLCSCKKCEK
jgi:hypothetical protein